MVIFVVKRYDKEKDDWSLHIAFSSLDEAKSCLVTASKNEKGSTFSNDGWELYDSQGVIIFEIKVYYQE